jgi:hypothetical protein
MDDADVEWARMKVRRLLVASLMHLSSEFWLLAREAGKL